MTLDLTMTGIIGIIYKNGNHPAGKVPLLQFLSKIHHRGVRGQYLYKNKTIEILVRGNQQELTPNVVCVDGMTDSILALDGHVYNADILKIKYGAYVLDPPGKDEHIDAAAMLAGYRAVGIDIFKEAVGSFSGVLKDRDTLLGFKDPIGGKSLYCCETASFLILASELKTLSPLKETIFPINPGHILSSREGVVKYFDFPAFQKSLPGRDTEEFYTTNIRELVKKTTLMTNDGDEKETLFVGGYRAANFANFLVLTRISYLS